MTIFRRFSLVILIATAVGFVRAGPPFNTPSFAESVRTWQAAVNGKDVDGLVAYFDDDIAAFYAPHPSLGKEVNRRFWVGFFRQKNANHPITTERIISSASDDLGYVLGNWQVSWDDQQGRQEARGKYIAVWLKDKGGRWRITALLENSYESKLILDSSDSLGIPTSFFGGKWGTPVFVSRTILLL